MTEDPLQEVRSIRRTISTECANEPSKVLEYYRQHQEATKRTGKSQFVSDRPPGATSIGRTGSVEESQST